jgi:hypothetical protein
VAMHHGLQESLGYIFQLRDVCVGYISDTGYAMSIQSTEGVFNAGEPLQGEVQAILSKHDDLKQAYAQVCAIIAHLNDFSYNKHSKFHLSGYDLLDILQGSSAMQCYIAHLNAASAIHRPML